MERLLAGLAAQGTTVMAPKTDSVSNGGLIGAAIGR